MDFRYLYHNVENNGFNVFYGQQSNNDGCAQVTHLQQRLFGIRVIIWKNNGCKLFYGQQW
jgi:hypothetical protein